jgi:hypothetical protein
MGALNLSAIETRLLAIEASYKRQLTLAGKPGYNPQLTVQLKEDLEWLLDLKQKMLEDPEEGRLPAVI